MAVTIETLTGQDSPNSGRIKVNSNFGNIKNILDTHQTYLTALSGDVVSTDASQTIINKILTSNNATSGAGNSITIAREDFFGDWFGVANTYSGISYVDAKIHNINKTNNTITISGFGGIEPTNDTANRVIGIGFPATAYLDHVDGNQSLVINERTRLGSATLDVNGLTTLRHSLEIGDASDGSNAEAGNAHALIHIHDGLDGTSRWTDFDMESRGASSVYNNGPYINLMRNPNNQPMAAGQTLGGITFRGNHLSGSKNYDSARSSTRIIGTALKTYANNDQQSSLDFYTQVGGTSTATRVMRVMGGPITTGASTTPGIGVVIGQVDADTAAGGLGTLTIRSSYTGTEVNTTDQHTFHDLMIQNDGGAGIVMVSKPNQTHGIVFQEENSVKGGLWFKHNSGTHREFKFNTGSYASAGVVFDVRTTKTCVGIGPDNEDPTHALQVHGDDGFTVSSDVFRVNNEGNNEIYEPIEDVMRIYDYGTTNIIQIGQARNFRLTHGGHGTHADMADGDNDFMRYNTSGQLTFNASNIILKNSYDRSGASSDGDLGGGRSLNFLARKYQTVEGIETRVQQTSGMDLGDYGGYLSDLEFQSSGSGGNDMGGIVFSTGVATPKLRISHGEGVHIGHTSDGKHAAPGYHHQQAGVNTGLKTGITMYGSVLNALGSDSSTVSSSTVGGIGDVALLTHAIGGYYDYSTNGNFDARVITLVDGNSAQGADGGLLITTGSHGNNEWTHFEDDPIASFRANILDRPQVRFGLTKDELNGITPFANLSAGSADAINYTLAVGKRGNSGAAIFDGNVHVDGTFSNLGGQLHFENAWGYNGLIHIESSGNKHKGINIEDIAPMTSTGHMNIVLEQTGTGSGKRTVGIANSRSGTASRPGGMQIGAINAAQFGGVDNIDVNIECRSSAAFLLPRGTTAQRPGGASSDNNPYGGQIRFNTTTNNVEFYNNGHWQNVGVPPIGSTFLQYGPADLDNSPNTLYPGTTWVTGDVPADHFIRSVGSNRGSDVYRGARPYMTQQDDMVAQHTHRSTATVGGFFEWNSGTNLSGNKGRYADGGSWIERTASDYWADGGESIYSGWMASQPSTNRFVYNQGYQLSQQAIDMFTYNMYWYASESFNNAHLDIDNFGIETGRVVHHNDRRVEPGNSEEDAYGFHQEAGAGRVRSYGGSNGAGGFWAGYIGGNNQKYYTGDENRPMNVAIKFWRRTA